MHISSIFSGHISCGKSIVLAQRIHVVNEFLCG